MPKWFQKQSNSADFVRRGCPSFSWLQRLSMFGTVSLPAIKFKRLLHAVSSTCRFNPAPLINALPACRAPRFSTEEGKFFLANGNEIRRLRNSELQTWLFEDESRATERNLRSYRKICVVRTHKVIGPSRTVEPQKWNAALPGTRRWGC